MLLAELRERGIEAEQVAPGVVEVRVPFAYRDVEGALAGVVEVVETGVVLGLVVPVRDVSLTRLEALLPDDLSDDELAWELDLDADELALYALAAGVTELDAGVVDDELRPRILGLLHELVDAGAIDLVDAFDDEEIVEIRTSLERCKREDPRRAVDLCRYGAERARALGNPTLGSLMEGGAADCLLMLGDVTGAAALLEPAWEQMDQPLHWPAMATSMAQLRAQQGRVDEALELIEASLEMQDDPAEQASLKMVLGLLLAGCGRDVEAARILAASVEDPRLDDTSRATAREQLEITRRRAGTGPVLSDPGEGIDDVLDAANARLNALSAVMLRADRPGFLASRGFLAEMIGLVGMVADRLGPGQLARLAMARGCVANMEGHTAAARAHFAEARVFAAESGDPNLARSVAFHERTTLDPSAAVDDLPLTPFERMAALVNRAFGELQSLFRRMRIVEGGHLTGPDRHAMRDAFRRGQVAALEAIEVADTQRHRYTGVADRAAWAETVAKAYEAGLATSAGLEDSAVAIEVLERARAQGAPAGAEDVAPTTTPDDLAGAPLATEPDQESRVPGARLLALLRESLGDRPVARPLVASIRTGDAPDEGPVERIDLDTVVRSIAGRPAWWWGCQAFGERIYWAVRAPDGRTWSGSQDLWGGLDRAHLAHVLDAAFPDATAAQRRAFTALRRPAGRAQIRLAELADLFRSTSRDDDRPHVLLGDEEGRREEVLRALASTVLPPPLVAAVRAAARRREPLRLVWAAPRELARVPLGLLPIDDDAGEITRFMEGAVVVMAPPTSLVAARPAAAVAAPPGTRPVLLVLGHGHELGMLDGLIGQVAPTPRAVLGTTRHVVTKRAAAVARPDAVLQAWRANVESVGVYYGHVDHGDGASTSASLRLTDGTRPAGLPASRLLTPLRQGAPHTVVLAGCSSLSVTDAGTGEWWGLATGLLWQGTSHVVGSAWDVRPGPATENLVGELARELRATDDPAVALHRLQLARYRAWQGSGRSDPTVAPPYDWAGWSILSAGGSPIAP